MGKKLKDERIIKKTNLISAPLYPLILFLTILVIALKLIFFTKDINNYILEIIAILGSVGYLVIRSILTKVPLWVRSDECIKEIQDSYRTHSFYFCVFTYVFGEFILMFFLDQIEITTLYIPIWFIPTGIYTILSIKNGLLVWGSKKAQKTGIQSFQKRVVIGSLFFGIFTGWSFLFKDGNFKPSGLLWVAGLSAGWGIPFYLIMKALIGKSEQNSDKELKEAEQNSDKMDEGITYEK